MPIVALERLPLPSMRTLRLYACCSVTALTACLYVTMLNVSVGPGEAPPSPATWMGPPKEAANPGEVAAINSQPEEGLSNVLQGRNKTMSSLIGGGDGAGGGFYEFYSQYWAPVDATHVTQFVVDVFQAMMREPICMWTLINMAFCSLILIGTSIQQMVFGELRVSEQQQLKDKFWNFVFYKFIFVFGIINVQYIDEVLLWCFWFSFLGFLHLLCQLTKDRFEYLSFSPATPVWNHVKLLVLLAVIFAMSGFMLLISVFVGFFGGINTFAFMSAEVILLSVRTLYVMIRYAMHLYDSRSVSGDTAAAIIAAAAAANTATLGSNTSPSASNHGNSGAGAGPPTSDDYDNNNPRSWEKRGPLAYYVELIFEMTALVLDLVHHLHMLVWSNIFLSMASLVICMQLRYLFHEIQRRYRKHRNYLWVRKHLEQNYPMASREELTANCDNCAICWEKMDTARRLPCAHLFHNMCLLSWLEQDTSCPTCRLGLSIRAPNGGLTNGGLATGGGSNGPQSNGVDASSPGVGGVDQMGGGDQTSSGVASDVDGLLDVGDEVEDGGALPPIRFNHFFHFDGSRYVSWLPSFSVEVSHAHVVSRGQLMRMRQEGGASVMATAATATGGNSQLDGMARNVQEMFPDLPLPMIVTDLRMTRSMNETVGNILAGRLVAPPQPTTTFRETLMGTESGGEGGGVARQTTTSWMNWWSHRKEKIDGEEELNIAGRFSKSSTEREKILTHRKECLLQNARKRYIEKQRNTTATVSPKADDDKQFTVEEAIDYS